MKKLLSAIILLVVVSSCFKGSYYESSYTLVADFEYSNLNYDEIFGKDSVYYDDAFVYGDFGFYNKHESTSFDGGMALSIAKNPHLSEGTSYTDDISPYSVYNKYAAGQTNTFAVFYENNVLSMMPEHEVCFGYTSIGTCTMSYCYVNNTTLVAASILDDRSPYKFSDGDYLKLVATGYLNGTKTGEASISLAEFNSARDSVVSEWTKFDLSALGSVEYVDFSFETSKQNMPKYACIDDFTASIAIKQ